MFSFCSCQTLIHPSCHPRPASRAAAGAVTLVALVSVLLAMNVPDCGRNIIYGVVILVLLLLYGREEKEE